MNDIALASIILVSMAATTVAVIGIAYLCTHKDKPSENNSEPGFSDSQQLNSKLNVEQNPKNKDKNASNLQPSFSPTSTELKPKNSTSTSNNTPNLNTHSSQIPRELRPKIKVTDTYTINGRKINLCRQKQCDCWAYAAAFVACLRGKGGDTVTLETGYFKNIVDSELSLNRWKFEEAESIQSILNRLGIVFDATTTGDVANSEEFATLLRSGMENGRVTILHTSGHWVTVCEDCGNGDFRIYDSKKGRIITMNKDELFAKLPIINGKHYMDVIYT
jgi:hypothetical protein